MSHSINPCCGAKPDITVQEGFTDPSGLFKKKPVIYIRCQNKQCSNHYTEHNGWEAAERRWNLRAK